MKSIDEEGKNITKQDIKPEEKREESDPQLRQQGEECRDDCDDGTRDGPCDISHSQLLTTMSSLTEDRFLSDFNDFHDTFDHESPPAVVVKKTESSLPLPPRPRPSYPKQHLIHEEASTTTASTSKSSAESFASTKQYSETSKSKISASKYPNLSVSPQPSRSSRRTRTPSPARRVGPSSVASNRTHKTYAGKGLSTKKLKNNALSRQINEEICHQKHMDQQRQYEDALAETKRRPTGFFGFLLYIVIFLLRLLLKILMVPKIILCYLFRWKSWSANSRTILITGASSGIGAEIARQYAAQGAQLALVARTEKDLRRVEKECNDLGARKVRSYTADLRNLLSIQTAMKLALLDFAHFEVVILNAGRSQGCYFEEIKDVKQIDHLLKLNVTGSIATLHHLLPYMPKSRDSRIVLISNTAGIVATPYQSIYSASKHALTGFSNSLRMELKNTYQHDAPKVCLVNFPEVLGTKLNISHMDMGAKLPAARWYSSAGIPLTLAVHDLLPAIASGRREYGQRAWKFQCWRLLYPIIPSWVDGWMMKHVQNTHYRPRLDDQKHIKTADSDLMSVADKSYRSF